MDELHLPSTPGSTTALLHPFNVFHVSQAVLRHALSALNPDTAFVRRAHHRHPSAGSHRTRTAVTDAGSVASSTRHSRRSADGERVHRRHRSSSGDGGNDADSVTGGGSGARRHRTGSLESGSLLVPPSVSSSTRRTRSAEEPLAVSRRASVDGAGSTSGTNLPGASGSRGVRRSHSDGVRGRTRSLPGDEAGASASSGRLASFSSHPLSPAATAAAASGLTPPLAPPPPVTDIGKPPLSSRRLSASQASGGTAGGSSDGAAAAPTRSRHRHHRSGSSSGGAGGGAGGLSSSSGGAGTGRRSSRSLRSSDNDGDTDDDGAGSVIVIADKAASRLAAKSVTGVALSWSPTGWWRRLRSRNVTRPAYLIDHVIHAVPVAMVHYCCELKRQLATLPLLRFSDSLPPAVDAASPAAAWLPTEERFERAPAPQLAQLLGMRWLLSATSSYLEKFCFLDESLVVRQLRSKRTPRRLIGWGLRLVSHTLFDPFLLSFVVPVLLSASSTPSALLPSPPPAVRLTVPGAVRGLAMSAAAVTVQWVLMPMASKLVDRAVLTVFEAVEYLTIRRYAQWSDDEDEDDDLDDLDGDMEDDRASMASGVSEGARSQQSVASAASASVAAGRGAGAPSAAKRVEREQRQLERERRERRRRRARRVAQREHAMRVAILRAIVYRVVASLIAQSLVDHPLSVLVELLRGRATLHITGLLQPYAAMPAASDGLTWENLVQYVTQLYAAGAEADGGVPPLVAALRRAGRAVTEEALVVTSSVLATSGQTEAMAAVQRRAARTVVAGGIPSATDSVEFMSCTLSSLTPFYYGIQFTVIDRVLGFYMAVWTRLTKQ